MCDLICCFLNRMVIFVCVGWVRMSLFTCHLMFRCCYYKGAKLCCLGIQHLPQLTGAAVLLGRVQCAALHVLCQLPKALARFCRSQQRHSHGLGAGLGHRLPWERNTARSTGSDTQAATSACEVDGNSRLQLLNEHSE